MGTAEIIIAVLGSGVAIEIVRQLMHRRNTPKQFTPVDALQLQADVGDVLADLIRKTGAHSALLLQSENGAALAIPGQAIQVTVTCERLRDAASGACQHRFVRTVVDSGYNDLLRAIISDSIVVDIALCTGSEILRDLYANIGVVHSWQIRVPSPTNVIRYISVRWDADNIHDGSRNHIREAVDRVALIMARYDESIPKRYRKEKN